MSHLPPVLGRRIRGRQRRKGLRTWNRSSRGDRRRWLRDRLWSREGWSGSRGWRIRASIGWFNRDEGNTYAKDACRDRERETHHRIRLIGYRLSLCRLSQATVMIRWRVSTFRSCGLGDLLQHFTTKLRLSLGSNIAY